MCFFFSVNAPLLSMIPSANASARWSIITLILIAGIVGVVFCLLLGPSILFMHPFHMLYQWFFSVNDPFCQFILPLIDLYIDSWDCWDCVLSVIAVFRYYMHPPPTSCWSVFTSCLYLLSIHMSCVLLIGIPLWQWSLLSMILSVDGKQYWYLGLLELW